MHVEYLRYSHKPAGTQAIDAFFILLNLLEAYTDLPSKVMLRHAGRESVEPNVSAHDGVYRGGVFR